MQAIAYADFAYIRKRFNKNKRYFSARFKTISSRKRHTLSAREGFESRRENKYFLARI